MTTTTLTPQLPETQAPILIGIADTDREAIARRLQGLLADTYVLYLKTQRFHWNVTGMQFSALHRLFEEQYRELAEAVDEIAERIRALGFFVPATHSEFQQLSELKEQAGIPTASEMIQHLLVDNETIARRARSIFKLAAGASDEPTSDLLTQRMKVHEHAAWTLRSHLQ